MSNINVNIGDNYNKLNVFIKSSSITAPSSTKNSCYYLFTNQISVDDDIQESDIKKVHNIIDFCYIKQYNSIVGYRISISLKSLNLISYEYMLLLSTSNKKWTKQDLGLSNIDSMNGENIKTLINLDYKILFTDGILYILQITIENNIVYCILNTNKSKL